MRDALRFTTAILILALAMWIVVPGPVPTLFVLTVAATELWPIVFVAALASLAFATLATRGLLIVRIAAAICSASALVFSLVPPAAYALHGPAVPFTALLKSPFERNSASRKAIVLDIYGGAWARGSPSTDAALDAIIASWGYRVYGLGYPHAPRAHWPAQLDAVLQQIDHFKGQRIIVLGHSSGAQLAMIAGARRARQIAAIVTYESPVDLELGYKYPAHPDVINARQIMSDLCGGTPADKPACYHSASPRYAVHSGMPPVLMIAAGRDHVVDLGFEHVLRDTLRHGGVRVTYIELPWADHAFETATYGFHNRIALWYLHRFLDGNAQ